MEEEAPPLPRSAKSLEGRHLTWVLSSWLTAFAPKAKAMLGQLFDASVELSKSVATSEVAKEDHPPAGHIRLRVEMACSGRLLCPGLDFPSEETVSALKLTVFNRFLSGSDKGQFNTIVLFHGQGGPVLADTDELGESGMVNGETVAVTSIPRVEWDEESYVESCPEQIIEDVPDGQRFHTGNKVNNYKPVLAKVGYTTGVHTWRVKGTCWGYAQTGIAKRSIDVWNWVGQQETARVFSNGSISDQSEYTHRIDDLDEYSTLTLQLDMDRGTFSAYLNDAKKPWYVRTRSTRCRCFAMCMTTGGIFSSADLPTLLCLYCGTVFHRINAWWLGLGGSLHPD